MPDYDLPADEYLALLAIHGGKSFDAAFDQQGMPNIRRARLQDIWYLRGWSRIVKDGNRPVAMEFTKAGEEAAANLAARAVS